MSGKKTDWRTFFFFSVSRLRAVGLEGTRLTSRVRGFFTQDDDGGYVRGEGLLHCDAVATWALDTHVKHAITV